MSNSVSFTSIGLAELARIVAVARKSNGDSMPEFGFRTGLSYVTIWNIEKQKRTKVSLETLAKLAPYVERTYEELIAICSGKQQSEPLREYLKAEDILPAIHQLPLDEKRRFRQLNLSTMSNEELVEAMKEMANEVNERLRIDNSHR